MEDKVKNLLVLLIAAGVIVLAFYFATLRPGFQKGSEVDRETFAGILADADKVHIVMDIRNAADEGNRWGIMQCGVDFAGSYALAAKDVDYFSFDAGEGSFPLIKEDYCVHSEEMQLSLGDCINIINSGGITIYIQKGTETKYYTNGMVVGVGSDYQLDTCSIKIR